jgi:F-box-like
MLPDVVLLEIFDFYMDEEPDDEELEAWHTLVHVCRSWRSLVFGSPRRLNLQLYCTHRTPVRQTLDVWPLLPIVIKVYSVDRWDNGNILAALEHNDRISELVMFDIPSSETEKALAALQQPFPALTYLQFQFKTESAPVLPASFFGGLAPALRTLYFDRIPFPGLPKLLLTATHLIFLHLWRIPHSGYISPEAMVTALCVDQARST